MIAPAVRATIDLSAIVANYQFACQRAGNTRVIPVIKANAYGHGAIQVAQELAQLQHLAPTHFAVARMSEAQLIREAGIKQDILVLSEHIDKTAIQCALEHQLDLVIHHPEHIDNLLAFEHKQRNEQCNLWLKFDSGMHRLGLDKDQLDDLIKRLDCCSLIDRICLMSHFANAEDNDQSFNEKQYRYIENIAKRHPDKPLTIANSAALLRHQKYHADYVRPGIMLYGSDPFYNTDLHSPQIRCSMRLEAQLISTRNIKAGESVGYNRRWFAGRDSTIATLAIGYADGYPRHAQSGTPVFINGSIVPLVGTVSMDTLSVDISDIAPVQLGSYAELWGANVHINEVATHAQTIAYELFTQLGGRTQRQYATIEQ